MEKFDKEFEKLRDLEDEYTAMYKLNADEEILKKQRQKILRQSKKIVELQKAMLEEQK